MSKNLNQIGLECRDRLLKMYKAANAGHIGASLSCMEILIFAAFEKMRPEDHLILSKGHAAGAMYVVFEAAGLLPKGSVDQFYKDGGDFAAHPPCTRKYSSIPFGTGSLGHGLGIACGMALAGRFTGKKKNIFAVLSDGELNEGSVWESVMFAAHHKLNNLTVFIDKNGLQGIGSTAEIIDLGSLEEKFSAFGWNVTTATDGNSFESLRNADAKLGASADTSTSAGTGAGTAAEKPRVIIANTVKGHSVSYMENKYEWHYLPMNDEQFQKALSEAGKYNA